MIYVIAAIIVTAIVVMASIWLGWALGVNRNRDE
jgi:hypothetical protein